MDPILNVEVMPDLMIWTATLYKNLDGDHAGIAQKSLLDVMISSTKVRTQKVWPKRQSSQSYWRAGLISPTDGFGLKNAKPCLMWMTPTISELVAQLKKMQMY